MSNDSREAFEAAVIANYEQPPCLDRMGHSYEDSYIDQAWWGWQAAQSGHAKRIELLEAEINRCYKMNCGRDYMHLPLADAVFQTNETRHAEEREALVRKCADICDRHTRMSWNDDRRAQAKLLRGEILALLNSDTPDVLENSGGKDD